MSITVDPQTKTMKSTDLHQLVFKSTGKFALLVDFHRKIREMLINQEGAIIKPSPVGCGHVQYYNLDEVQYNMVLNSVGLTIVGGDVRRKITEGTRLNYEHGTLCAIESVLGVELIRQYRVGDYRIDGYDAENNIAYEIDEPHHLSQGSDDYKRQCFIESKIGCTFKRIKIK